MIPALLITVYDRIVQNAPNDVVKAVYDVCFDDVIRIVLQSEDHSEMQVYILTYASLSHMLNR